MRDFKRSIMSQFWKAMLLIYSWRSSLFYFSPFSIFVVVRSLSQLLPLHRILLIDWRRIFCWLLLFKSALLLYPYVPLKSVHSLRWSAIYIERGKHPTIPPRNLARPYMHSKERKSFSLRVICPTIAPLLLRSSSYKELVVVVKSEHDGAVPSIDQAGCTASQENRHCTSVLEPYAL